ncbi:stage V sporulation protein AE [Clostridium tetanomorphum]|uniref:Stage V sporulation protein AE n=2 Tax=Clostridium TaxID=1485 RepID=A0A923J0X1_CLOTT|nr:stage V sporulation protein AE [Clostridium tetanomorphum]KAJ53656.1 stage V sporulation protein AE [Clostridium tetanomorphum DSM 665]MBC2397165.1 stage V sporulation protein AE [Clostridium tetanomorphum]MBP1862377.1 stage V sporulation protein AE [Clostridium tetanomorphum]NRS85783.1 stage V sporulation protein AE [Clostridium tetanomorphum]NRZ96208.1 stage V sporulation protein AE [Clostridium tetanomorphum]
MLNDYIRSFVVGGGICVIAQILIDKTKFTPARILVSFVTIGVILGALNIYDVVIEFGKAGATVPLPGFGSTMAKSTIKEVNEKGLIGAFTGGIKGGAGGITAAIIFGYIMSLLFNPKTKK